MNPVCVSVSVSVYQSLSKDQEVDFDPVTKVIAVFWDVLGAIRR